MANFPAVALPGLGRWGLSCHTLAPLRHSSLLPKCWGLEEQLATKAIRHLSLRASVVLTRENLQIL